LGNNMKLIREQKQLTQEQLASKLKVSRSWLEKVENGKVDPSLKLALRIAAVLDCSIEDIFFLK
jgi:putative transcriptional regulator